MYRKMGDATIVRYATKTDHLWTNNLFLVFSLGAKFQIARPQVEVC